MRGSNPPALSTIPGFADLPATAFVVTSGALDSAVLGAIVVFGAFVGLVASGFFAVFSDFTGVGFAVTDFAFPVFDFVGADFGADELDDPAGFEELEARPVPDAAARDVPLRARLVTESPRGGDGSAWLAGVGS